MVAGLQYLEAQAMSQTSPPGNQVVGRLVEDLHVASGRELCMKWLVPALRSRLIIVGVALAFHATAGARGVGVEARAR